MDVSPLGLCLVTATSRHWACVTVDFLPYTGQVRGEVWSRPQTRCPGEQVPPSLECQQGDARRRASGRWQEEASHRRDCAVRQGTVSRIFGGGMAPAELQDSNSRASSRTSCGSACTWTGISSLRLERAPRQSRWALFRNPPALSRRSSTSATSTRLRGRCCTARFRRTTRESLLDFESGDSCLYVGE